MFQKSNFEVGGSARLLGGTGRKIEVNVENGQNIMYSFEAHKLEILNM